MSFVAGFAACGADAYEWPPCESSLLEALEQHAQAPLLVVHCPAPVMPPDWLLRALPHEDAFVWSPPEGVAFAGAGVARQIPVAGEGLPQRAAGLFEGVVEVNLGTSPAVPLRAVAALPFELGRSDAGAVFLPRWRFALDHAGAWLTLVTRPEERGDELSRRRVVEEYSRLRQALDAVANARRYAAGKTKARVLTLDHGDVEGWKAAVARTVDAIRHDRFAKVVLARSAEVELDQAFDACDVLERLPGSWGTRYALRQGSVTLVGLSPERLVTRHGPSVFCDALAGTAKTGSEGALQASAKELVEHNHVVREIVRSLTPLCRTVEAATTPQVRLLRHLSHLLTPVRGELDGKHHVLTLVDAVHPTPAIGGVPGAGALAFLREVEGCDRGLYAGPVGWFDEAGDGDFWVALRGGLIEGRRAKVWAGAGIVADSQPEAELAETQLKQRAFLCALGADA